jgi:hypothetical protein
MERLFGDPRQGFESSDGLGWEPYRAPMRILRGSSQAEVLATFVRGELDSSRYGDVIRRLLREAGADESLLREPDLDDANENRLRESVLERHRSWSSREGLFGRFPQDVAWSLVSLTRAEVLSILYIDWDWWLRLSGGTRLPVDAAARIRANEVRVQSAEDDEPIAARLRSSDPPPELIVVAEPDCSKLVLLEGHVRLTAYALCPAYLPDELAVYLGTSPEMSRWALF